MLAHYHANRRTTPKDYPPVIATRSGVRRYITFDYAKRKKVSFRIISGNHRCVAFSTESDTNLYRRSSTQKMRDYPN